MKFDFVSRKELGVYRYLSNYGWDCSSTYDAAYNASSSDWSGSPPGYICVGQLFRPTSPPYVPSGFYRICRGICTYDLTNLSPSIAVSIARLQSTGTLVTKPGGIDALVFDGTGLTGAQSDFGLIRTLSPSLGSAKLYTGDYGPFHIDFNSLGLEFIESKAGGIMILAFRVSSEGTPPGNCPSTQGTEEFYLDSSHNIHMLLINESGGYIWVEGSKFAYLDDYRTKRITEGTLEGATGKIAGYCWVEGTKFRYIDSSGNERYIEGTQEGATGKTPGHPWIEETKFRYIDSSGNERYFEGA